MWNKPACKNLLACFFSQCRCLKSAIKTIATEMKHLYTWTFDSKTWDIALMTTCPSLRQTLKKPLIRMGNDKTLSFVLSLSLICVSAEPSAQGSVELFIVPHLSWHQCVRKQAFSLVCKWGKLKNNSFQRWETVCRFGSLERAYSSVKEDLVEKDLCAVL